MSETIERLVLAPSARTLARCLLGGSVLSCIGSAHAFDYVVNTIGDPGSAGKLTLRQAIAEAGMTRGNTVRFDASLVDSTITIFQGAIVLNSNYDVRIEGLGSSHLTISGNDTSGIFQFAGDPGAMHRTSISISGVTIEHGYVSGQTRGGCIDANYTDLSLDDVTVTRCTTLAYGGGISTTASKLTVQNSRIIGNAGILGGGGIATAAGSAGVHGNIYIYDSTIGGNSTYRYGGGIYFNGVNDIFIGRALIANNTINSPRNETDIQGGGGIALKDVAGITTISDTTVTGNFTYAAGGGIGIFTSSNAQYTRIILSTIVGNYGGYHIGSNGLHPGGEVVLNSTIIANNVNRGDSYDLDGSLYSSNSFIKNAHRMYILTGTPNWLNTDPELGPLANNGGPTFTMMPSKTSPVIDKGDNGATTNPRIDQRGEPRIVDVFTDVGAVERQVVEDVIFASGFEFY